MVNEEHYQLTRLKFADFARELDAAWSELQDPQSKLCQDARTKGVDVSQLRGLKREEAIRVEATESGFDITAVVMAFVAHGVVEATRAAWLHLIWPRIKGNLGEDSVKPAPNE